MKNNTKKNLVKQTGLNKNKFSPIYNGSVRWTKTRNKIGSHTNRADERTDERFKHRTIFQNQLLESADRIVTCLKAVRKMIFLTESVEERLRTTKSNRLNGVILVKCLALIANEIPSTEDYSVMQPLRRLVLVMCEEILRCLDRKRNIKVIEPIRDYEKPFLTREYGCLLRFLTGGEQNFIIPTSFECINNCLRTKDLIDNFIKGIEDLETSLQRFSLPVGKSFHFQHNDQLYRSPTSMLTLIVNRIEETVLDKLSIQGNAHGKRRKDAYPTKIYQLQFPLYWEAGPITMDKLQRANDKMMRNQIKRNIGESIEKITKKCCGLIVHCKIV
ncbi:unnamed protein product [Dimorphilus gyrociliatus]|uniref:Uncharacterized protein n=1 Tax=Dimorphilus gyrociliatus TaxID=2664684 RepID=A0A7I8VXT8_9ANNE|nr:unnamed protein product [Dimorphilus gyrociliatus]